MTSQFAVSLTNLIKIYTDRRALDDISVDINRGSRTVVLGHNGAGKSTLLEIIATLRTPTSGTVTIDGFDAVKEAREARRRIGLTPQANALDPLASPCEVLDFQGAALGFSRASSVRRREELLELFGLDSYKNMRIAKLSGGTRRKLDLAVALVAEPPIVILDEPTSGLDPVSRMDFWSELKRLDNEGCTLIVSTQDLHEAENLATDVLVLREGRITAFDTPTALKQRVGERTLVLKFVDAVAAQAVVRQQAGTRFQIDPTSSAIVRVALCEAPDALKRVLQCVGELGESVEELRLAEPSLDDVFIALASR